MSDKQPIATAPRCGRNIVGIYPNGDEVYMCWSARPVCMLGSRNGGYPPGWATACGGNTDSNLPLDEPLYWREDE